MCDAHTELSNDANGWMDDIIQIGSFHTKSFVNIEKLEKAKNRKRMNARNAE